MDFEKEKLFEETFPSFYSLLSEIALGVEEGRSEWEVVGSVLNSCEDAEKVLEEIEKFLKNNPSQFEHVVEDVGNNYFDDTEEFLRWVEQLKSYVTSVKRRLCR